MLTRNTVVNDFYGDYATPNLTCGFNDCSVSLLFMSKVSYWRLIGSMHSINKKASKKDCKRKAICLGFRTD